MADLITVFVAAVLFGVFLNAGARRVAHWTGMSSGLSLAAILGIAAVVLGTAGWLLAPGISGQASQLADELPQTVAQAKQWLASTGWGKTLIEHAPGGRGVVHRVMAAASTTLDAFADLLIVLFVGLYLAADPGLYRRGLLRLVPARHRQRVNRLIGEMGGALEGWLLGKMAGMAMVAVASITGLLLLGVPLAVALGVMAGLLDFIPNIGPLIALVPAVLVALSVKPVLALWVAALYIGVQFVESYIMMPLIQKRTVSLPPALTIASQVALGVLLGPGGLLIATPLLVIVLVAAKDTLAVADR